MQQKRENERKIVTKDKLFKFAQELTEEIVTKDKLFKFAQELTEELLKDTWGVEGPVLSTIAEEDEGDSDFDTNSVKSAQQDLDAISREPQEFTHHIPAYKVLASQSN